VDLAVHIQRQVRAKSNMTLTPEKHLVSASA
jgi:hypothetical protein